MKALDIFILALLVWGGYSGFKRGLISEVFSTGAFVVATLISVKILDQVVELCSRWHKYWGGLVPYVVFVLTFVVIVVVITGLGRFFKYLVRPTLLGSIDRIIGIMVGIAKWGIFISTFIWLGSLFRLKIPDAYTEGTFLFPIVQPFAPKFLVLCSSWWHSMQEWLYTTGNKRDN